MKKVFITLGGGGGGAGLSKTDFCKFELKYG